MRRLVAFAFLIACAHAFASERPAAAPSSSPSSPSPVSPASPAAAKQVEFVERDGRVVFAAEHFTRVVQGSEMTDHSFVEARAEGASGGKAMEASPNTGAGVGDRTTGPGLEYAVRFAKAGTWYVWLRLLGKSGQDDSIHAGLDGQAASFGGIGMCHSSYGRWEWVNSVWDRSGRVEVAVGQPGLHRFQLWMREDGVLVDKVVLTADPEFRPSGDGPAE